MSISMVQGHFKGRAKRTLTSVDPGTGRKIVQVNGLDIIKGARVSKVHIEQDEKNNLTNRNGELYNSAQVNFGPGKFARITGLGFENADAVGKLKIGQMIDIVGEPMGLIMRRGPNGPVSTGEPGFTVSEIYAIDENGNVVATLLGPKADANASETEDDSEVESFATAGQDAA